MRGVNQGNLRPRVIAALIVASIATVASVRLFVTATDHDDGPYSAQRQLEAAAGRIDREYVDEPVVVRPAPDPIVITLAVDRPAPVLEYLEEAGLNSEEARRWASFFARTSDSRNLKQGHSLTLYKDPEDGSLRELKYNLDDRIAVREETYGEGVIRSSQELIKYVMRPVAVAFQLKGDFLHEAARNDLPQPIVATLQSAFQERHPLSALPRGSAIKLIYRERISPDGTERTVTGLEAAEIRFGGETLSAFAFRDENGLAHLYDANGLALGPQTLRFPLNFQYVSSGFSFRRYHPILHEYRSHAGVDLVAHYGTPVKAIGDGRLISAGWCGELGRCVRIQHEGGMVSIYGHLSTITEGLTPGCAVRVGEVIGRVGTSGLSTGPHLHFAMEKDGQFVNPMTQSLGVDHRISPRMRALFDRFKQEYVAAFNRMPDFGGHFTIGHRGGTTLARGSSGAATTVGNGTGGGAHPAFEPAMAVGKHPSH
jgi:murein DD-endopeptidase MepM/ murein hydrolase activator NlpD